MRFVHKNLFFGSKKSSPLLAVAQTLLDVREGHSLGFIGAGTAGSLVHRSDPISPVGRPPSDVKRPNIIARGSIQLHLDREHLLRPWPPGCSQPSKTCNNGASRGRYLDRMVDIRTR